jgi:hypothetical protein
MLIPWPELPKFLSAHAGFTKAVLLVGTLLAMGVALCLDGRESEPVPDLTADKNPGLLRGLALDGDTLLLATGGMVVPPGQISKLRLWNAATGEERPALAGHVGEILTMAFSPDGKQVATAGWDRSIKVWDAATGQERAVLPRATNAWCPLAFDARSRLGWVEDGIVKYWDPATRAVEPIPGLQVGGALRLAISLDGRLLATVVFEKFVARLWEVPAGRLQAELRDAFSITCVAFAPDGRVLATGNSRGIVALWDTATAQQITTLTGLPACARGLAFSPDGKQLAAGDVCGTVKMGPGRQARIEVALDCSSRRAGGTRNAIKKSPVGSHPFSRPIERRLPYAMCTCRRYLVPDTDFGGSHASAPLRPATKFVSASATRDTDAGRLCNAQFRGHRRCRGASQANYGHLHGLHQGH